MNKNDYLEIGKVVNTFGIKGELKIQSDSDFIDYRFAVGKTIYFKMGRTIKEVKVSSFRMLKGNVIITVDNLLDINEIEKYIGATVLALKSDVPPLDDNEYLIDDLVGAKVYDTLDNYLGEVSDVIIIPSNDILEIKQEDGTTKLVPFVDEFIKEVSPSKIIINNFEVEE